MNKTVIIDYGISNLDSVKRAVEESGGRACVSAKARDIREATHLILPGVGAFAAGMKNLKIRGLDIVLTDHLHQYPIPFLGICLGMQLLATTGWEGGETSGLGWIEGEVQLLKPRDELERIPHVGWNEVNYEGSLPILENIPTGTDFYFVHSFHFLCKYPQNGVAHTPYGGGFVSVIKKDNIFGVQFHPEKSQKSGFQVFKNFLKLS